MEPTAGRPKSWRKPGLAAAHRWMLDHFENSDGLGAIFPPMIYTVVALECLGYETTPRRCAGRCETARRPAHRGREHGPGPALRLAGLGHRDRHDRPGRLAQRCPTSTRALLRPSRWLLDKEVRQSRRLRLRRPRKLASKASSRAAGTSSFTTSLYPGHRRHGDGPPRPPSARRWPTTRRSRRDRKRGLSTGCSRMQNKDGGWAAFDRTLIIRCSRKVPFADHNAMLDPSCADITARVIEIPRRPQGLQFGPTTRPSARALAYLWKTQEPEGCWYGRWGVNYIYGTWQVLRPEAAIDFPMDPPARRSGRPTGWNRSSSRRRLGRVVPSYDDPVVNGPGRADRLANRLGVLGLVSAGRGNDRVRAPGASSTCSTPDRPTGRGTRNPTPAPASRASSTSSTTSTASTSRLMALARYQAARLAPRRKTREPRRPRQPRPSCPPLPRSYGRLMAKFSLSRGLAKTIRRPLEPRGRSERNCWLLFRPSDRLNPTPDTPDVTRHWPTTTKEAHPRCGCDSR